MLGLQQMELKVRKAGTIYIVDINGEMDLYNAYKLKELVLKMIEKGIKNYVINLELVDYIDSSGIGSLIYICSTLKKNDMAYYISDVHGSVKKVMDLTKLTSFFPITANVDDAVLKLDAVQ